MLSRRALHGLYLLFVILFVGVFSRYGHLPVNLESLNKSTSFTRGVLTSRDVHGKAEISEQQ